MYQTKLVTKSYYFEHSRYLIFDLLMDSNALSPNRINNSMYV